MKVKNKDDFRNYLDTERAWRKHELSNMKQLVNSQEIKSSIQCTLIRSGILLLYAHWEGYIKKTAEAFFSYMNYSGLGYKNLILNLQITALLDRHRDFVATHGGFSSNFDKVQSIYAQYHQNEKFKVDINFQSDTKSNLSMEVLNNLLTKIGLDKIPFNSKKVYIDEKLLAIRNAIAHGERTDFDPKLETSLDDFNELFKVINELLDCWMENLSNHVEQELYARKI